MVIPLIDKIAKYYRNKDLLAR